MCIRLDKIRQFSPQQSYRLVDRIWIQEKRERSSSKLAASTERFKCHGIRTMNTDEAFPSILRKILDFVEPLKDSLEKRT